MRSLYVAALAAVMLLLSAPAWVHHSGAMFDRTQRTMDHGHGHRVPMDQPAFLLQSGSAWCGWQESRFGPSRWNGPNNLVRAGWKRSSIKPGDKVTVTINPLRDGRPGGWYLGITLADGRALGGAGDPAGSESDGGTPKS